MHTTISNNTFKVTNCDLKNKDRNRLLKMIENGRMRLSQEIMREPSNKELAQYLEMDLKNLEQVMMYANTFVSMDEECDERRDLHEVIACNEDVSEDDRIILNDSINSLDNLEKDIIKSRYYEDLTQSETASLLGISQVKVSRIEKKGKAKIKEYIKS